MPQYYPLQYPAFTGGVIDPGLIAHELDRIAKSHSTHSTSDFAASSIASSILVAPYTKFALSFGVVGSWALGSVNMTNKLAGLIWNFGTGYVDSGYITAEEIRDITAGPPQTVALNLYQNGSPMWSSAPTVGNDEYATYGPTVTTALTEPQLNTLSNGDEITIRATGNFTVFKNVVFHLTCYAEHTG